MEIELAKLDKNVNRRLTTTSSVSTVNDNLPVAHDPTTLAPSFLIEKLKTLIRQVIRDAAKVTGQDVAELLANTEGTLQRRVDVTPAVSKCLQQLTFDFLFILCKYFSSQRVKLFLLSNDFLQLTLIGVFQPESVGSQMIVAWVAFWSRTYPSNESVVTLETEEQPPGALMSTSAWQVLTPKQLLLLAQSTSPRESWTHVSTLLVQLMKADLIRYKDVQEQAVAVVRQEWPQVNNILLFSIHSAESLNEKCCWIFM